jgi:hypothetical protein
LHTFADAKADQSFSLRRSYVFIGSGCTVALRPLIVDCGSPTLWAAISLHLMRANARCILPYPNPAGLFVYSRQLY